MLRTYIANLGKYNEGFLVGEWVDLPITEEELEEVYERIGISEEPDENGNIYEETAIHDYETDLPITVGEWDNVLELSEAIEVFEDLQEWELETVKALLEAGYYSDILEAVEKVDNYTLIEAEDDYDLGYYFYEQGCIEIPEHLVNYFDFAAYGRDISFDGAYTSYGFLLG
ncbi:MAG: antirestriction protein ArdA [Firmicutes bacterium]|nr:antirestriction protein ArdA [Bacillota bacterium]